MGVPAPLRVGTDLAWHVLPDDAGATAERADNGEAELAVALSHLAGGPTLTDDLAARLSPLTAAGERVLLEPWQGPVRLGADALIAHGLARRLGEQASVAAPPRDLVDAMVRMRNQRGVIAMRFHAAVAAAAAGTPFVAVAHEPKLAALAARVRQPSVALDAHPDAFADAVFAALAGSAPDPHAVAEERRRAAATVALAQLVLTGDGDPYGLEHLALVPAPVPA
jgi:polysaccharide pyruvyl transferase WcaK-like protein